MTKAEKTKQTYEKILQAAIIEFGTKSYETASVNSICSAFHISKGLIYHNFKNKEDLYLQCVTACFQQMTAYLKSRRYQATTLQDSMEELLQFRQIFFQENPYYQNIFFNALLRPPVQLQNKLKKIRLELDQFNLEFYNSLLSKVQLRNGITSENAIEYFMIFQDMFNGYFQSKSYENKDFHSVISDHELKLSKLLNIMLYGIVKETDSAKKEN